MNFADNHNLMFSAYLNHLLDFAIAMLLIAILTISMLETVICSLKVYLNQQCKTFFCS
jgi:hypothetical protein